MPDLLFDWQQFAALATLLALPPLGVALRCAKATERVQGKYGEPIDKLRAEIEAQEVIPEIRDMLQGVQATARLTLDGSSVQRAIDRKLQDAENLPRWQKVRAAYERYHNVERSKVVLIRLVYAESLCLLVFGLSGLVLASTLAVRPSVYPLPLMSDVSSKLLILSGLVWVALVIPEFLLRDRLSKNVNPQS